MKALVQALWGAVRGHSITEILRSFPASVRVSQEVLQCAQALDKVYVNARYPNGFASRRPGDYFSATDSTVVYPEREFEQLRADPFSLVAQEFPFMAEL